MRLDQFTDESITRRYDYGDRTVFVTDLGPGADPTVDVADGTAIIVTADGHQGELDLPEGSVRAFNRNGIVTIEVRR